MPPASPSRQPCTIGLWGTYDVDNYGDVLFPRIAQLELLRRLPDATVRAFSPFGVEHPVRFDGGRPAEPLGRWSEARLAGLAGELDCVVVGGGEIVHTHYEHFTRVYGVDQQELRARDPARFFLEGLGPELERWCPVVWHAVGLPFDPSPEEAARLRTALAGRPYVSVRDEASKRRLEAAGVEREVVVVPDSAFLLRRLFPPALLEERIRFLRLMGWYPPEGPAIVVQGNCFLVPHVPALASALSDLLARHPDHSLVSVQTGPCHGDGEFADTLARALPQLRHRVPAEVDVSDVAAAIACSSAFVGVSLHGNITARVYGRPHVMVDLLGYSKLDAFARQVGSRATLITDAGDLAAAFGAAVDAPSGGPTASDLERQVDAHFDRIAEVAVEAARQRAAAEGDGAARSGTDRRLAAVEQELDLLRTAHDARGERLVAERSAFADQVYALRGENARLRAEMEAVARQAADAARRADEATEEAHRLRQTRTFRYLEPLRRVYGGIRRRLHT